MEEEQTRNPDVLEGALTRARAERDTAHMRIAALEAENERLLTKNEELRADTTMAYGEFKVRWANLSEPQRERVRAKANWEHMTLWAVLNEWWTDEDPKPLDPDHD